MNRLVSASVTGVRSMASAAPKTSTGIEHALAFKATHTKNPAAPEQYKVGKEYLHLNKYSYYDTEATMTSSRAPQPSNKKPDTQPKFK